MKPTYTEIKPKFHDEMIRAMFDCEKDRTSRFKKLGNVGDQFVLTHPDTLEQRWWMIDAIQKHPLSEVAMHMHKKEGFISEEDFMRFWVKMHPVRFDATQQVYVHILKPIEKCYETVNLYKHKDMQTQLSGNNSTPKPLNTYKPISKYAKNKKM